MTITHALDTALFDAAYSKAMAATGDTKAAMAAGLEDVLANREHGFHEKRRVEGALREELKLAQDRMAYARRDLHILQTEHHDRCQKALQLELKVEDLERVDVERAGQIQDLERKLLVAQSEMEAAKARVADVEERLRSTAIEWLRLNGQREQEIADLKALKDVRPVTLHINYNDNVGGSLTSEAIYNVQTWLYAHQHVSGKKTDGSKFERYNVRSVTTGGHPGETNVPVPPDERETPASQTQVEAYQQECDRLTSIIMEKSARIEAFEREVADLKAVRDTNKEWLDGWVKKDEASEARIAQLEAAFCQRGELAPERYEDQVKKLEMSNEQLVDDIRKMAIELDQATANLAMFVGDPETSSSRVGVPFRQGIIWVGRELWDAIREQKNHRIEELEAALVEARKPAADKPDSETVDVEIEINEKTFRDAIRQHEDREARLRSLTEENLRLSARLEMTSSAMEELQTRMANHIADGTRYLEQRNRAEHKCERLQEQLDEGRRLNEEFKAYNTTAAETANEQRQLIRNLQNGVSALVDANARQQSDIARQQSEIWQLKNGEKVRVGGVEVAQLQTERDQARQALADQIAAHTKTVEGLKLEIAVKTKTLQEIVRHKWAEPDVRLRDIPAWINPGKPVGAVDGDTRVGPGPDRGATMIPVGYPASIVSVDPTVGALHPYGSGKLMADGRTVHEPIMDGDKVVGVRLTTAGDPYAAAAQQLYGQDRVPGGTAGVPWESGDSLDAPSEDFYLQSTTAERAEAISQVLQEAEATGQFDQPIPPLPHVQV